MVGCNEFRFSLQIRVAVIFFLVTSSVSYSQSNYLFAHQSVLYVSAGKMSGKQIVCGIYIQAKDSSNRQIHVKTELLKDRIQIDSSEYDLFLDTSKHEFIYLDGRKYEAIQYRSKDSKIRINFEKPRPFEYYTREGGEKKIYWTSTYASVIFSNHLKKYNRILKVYFEK